MSGDNGAGDLARIAARFTVQPWLNVDFDLALRSERLARLLAFWQARREGAGLPARRQFDPLDMREHLGWLSIAQVEPDRTDLRYRLVGTYVVSWHHRDITGKLAGDVLPGPLPELLRHLVDNPRPARLHGMMTWHDRRHLAYETLVLPLADDGISVDRLLFGWSIPVARPLLRE